MQSIMAGPFELQTLLDGTRRITFPISKNGVIKDAARSAFESIELVRQDHVDVSYLEYKIDGLPIYLVYDDLDCGKIGSVKPEANWIVDRIFELIQ